MPSINQMNNIINTVRERRGRRKKSTKETKKKDIKGERRKKDIIFLIHKLTEGRGSLVVNRNLQEGVILMLLSPISTKTIRIK